MIRIGICDDSPAFLNQTKFIIDHWDAKPQIICTELFEDGDALLQAHFEKPFDIILLDIVMPLLNGIAAAKELRERDKSVKVVFLSSSADFAVESYTVKASDYILKPVEPARLFRCLTDLIIEIQGISRCITVKSLDATHRVPLTNIEYIESQGKHVLFFLSDGHALETPEPLYAFEHALAAEDCFFKCHRSYIVNIQFIGSFSAKEVVMRSGSRIPVSRSCQKDFETAYFSVVFRKAGDD